MAKAGGVVGFVGLDDISLELAASLLRSGYSVQAFEVSTFISLHLSISVSAAQLFCFFVVNLTYGINWTEFTSLIKFI